MAPDDDPTVPLPANTMQGRSNVDERMKREATALRLRRLGMTYDQVAEQMGFADKSGARQLVVRALERQVSENVVELRALENERLDTSTQALMGIIAGRDVDPASRIRAVDAYTRVSARRARLNGLDAPLQMEVSTGASAELVDALALLESVTLGDTVAGEVVHTDDADTTAAGPDSPGAAG